MKVTKIIANCLAVLGAISLVFFTRDIIQLVFHYFKYRLSIRESAEERLRNGFKN